jgi:hypothetical protein
METKSGVDGESNKKRLGKLRRRAGRCSFEFECESFGFGSSYYSCLVVLLSLVTAHTLVILVLESRERERTERDDQHRYYKAVQPFKTT